LSGKAVVTVCLLIFGFASTMKASGPRAEEDSVVAQLPRRMPQQQREEDEARAKMERDQAKKLNEERFENLKRDTEKLVKLSTELKEYVDKANKDTLSLNVVKKSEEIEKLAKSVKEKMKGSY
jgi:hypothetical protein